MKKTIPSQDLARRRRAESVKRRDARLRKDPTCSKCGKTKTFADFPVNVVDYMCAECRSAYSIERYRTRFQRMTPEQLRSLKDRENERQRINRKFRLGRMSKTKLAKFRKEVNGRNIAVRDELRHKVYMAYGGYKCSCCGETERTFLSIDHVDNDGARHKREHRIKTGEQLYRWLINRGFPRGFQVLCMNCQWGKRNNKGICPHKLSKV